MSYRNATKARPRVGKHSPLSPEEWAEIERLYSRGIVDNDIAEIVGCASKTVARWRRRTGRPSNDPRRK